MKCPACSSLMFAVEYDGVELDHCPACEGAWFDAGELGLLFADGDDQPHPELLAEVLAERPAADTREAPRRCPACRKTMRKVNIGPAERVLVDACPDGHGLWFDRGEVAQLARDLEFEPEHLPARVLAFVGEAFHGGRDPAIDHD